MKKLKQIFAGAIGTLIALATAAPAMASQVQIFSNEVREINANAMVLDNDNTTGDVILQFGGSLNEQLFWDESETEFNFTDDVEIGGNLNITGTLGFDTGVTVIEILDEDGFASDSDTALATQQSIKAYVDGAVSGSGHLQNTDTGTDSNSFILDNDDTTGDVTLQFGTTLAEQLFWDESADQFQLTDDLLVDGAITTTGIITAGSGAIAITDATGNIDGEQIAADTIDDDSIDFTDVTSTDITFDADTVATTAVYSGTTSLEETTAANDSGASIIGVFDEFDTSNGANVQDVLDDIDAAVYGVTNGVTPRTLFISMNDLTIQADGTANEADLFTDSETGANPHQFYILKTKKAGFQDLDLKFKVKLPEDFANFTNSGDLSFFYKNTGANNADSKLDILVEDNDGDDAFPAADGQTLFNAAWTNYTDEFSEVAFDPAAGEYIYVTVKGYATYDAAYHSPYAGEIVITYNGNKVE